MSRPMNRRRYRNPYAWDIDVSLNGEKLRGAWTAGRLDEALSHARAQGRRMWNGGKGVFRSVRVVVKRRSDQTVRLDWQRSRRPPR